MPSDFRVDREYVDAVCILRKLTSMLHRAYYWYSSSYIRNDFIGTAYRKSFSCGLIASYGISTNMRVVVSRVISDFSNDIFNGSLNCVYDNLQTSVTIEKFLE